MIKTEIFVGSASGYMEKSPAHMDMLIPASGYQGSDYLSVDLRPMGLDIFRGDGSNWVKPLWLRGRFNVESYWKSWIDHVL